MSFLAKKSPSPGDRASSPGGDNQLEAESQMSQPLAELLRNGSTLGRGQPWQSPAQGLFQQEAAGRGLHSAPFGGEMQGQGGGTGGVMGWGGVGRRSGWWTAGRTGGGQPNGSSCSRDDHNTYAAY